MCFDPFIKYVLYMFFGPIFFVNICPIGKGVSIGLQSSIPKCLKICKIFLLGQVNGMVCDIPIYWKSKTKLDGVSISNTRKFIFVAMLKKCSSSFTTIESFTKCSKTK